MNSQCSTSAHLINKMAPILFNKDPEIFVCKYSRDKEPDLMAYLKWPEDTTKYPLMAPVLYADCNRRASGLFKTNLLVLVSRYDYFAVSFCLNNII